MLSSNMARLRVLCIPVMDRRRMSIMVIITIIIIDMVRGAEAEAVDLRIRGLRVELEIG
jgi:hypothetical protein